MKPQDIIFLLVLLVLIYLKKPKLTVTVGLLCILASMPLFAKWIFFTAQHLVWYGAACFLLAVIVITLQLRDNKKE